MTRSPLALAALASAAVPGLDPATVEGTTQVPGHRFEVAFVQDTQHRRWVVRAPLTPAAGAQMEVTVSLLGLLARRLPFSVPTPKGFAKLKEGGRAVVYPYLTGRPLDLTELPAGPGLAAELGRAVAALHNLDLRLFDEAGLPSYDADTYRTRRLSDLDRAAATGHVPTTLLARWERQLEDVSLWRYAPTPTHGALSGDHVLAAFDDEEDAASGRVRAITGWEEAKVADPADDFAVLALEASPEAFDSVLEAYAHARVDRPDKHLERRARLAGELLLMADLLVAVRSGDAAAVQRTVDRLQLLQEDVADDETVDVTPSFTERPGSLTFHYSADDAGEAEQVAEPGEDAEAGEAGEAGEAEQVAEPGEAAKVDEPSEAAKVDEAGEADEARQASEGETGGATAVGEPEAGPGAVSVPPGQRPAELEDTQAIEVSGPAREAEDERSRS